MVLQLDEWIKNRKEKVEKRVIKGFPDSLRGQAWIKLSQIEKIKSEKPDLYKVNNWKILGNI